MVWTVRKEALWSVYGPVVRAAHGTYAIRCANMDRAGIYEQLYRMDRARDLGERLAVVKTSGFPCFNIGYADKDGNIYYLYNGSLPVHSENYDWSLYLPGNASETLWTSYVLFEGLPQVLNPSSGFVQNCNSTPYRTTTGPDNPRPENFSPTLGIQTNMANRALGPRSLRRGRLNHARGVLRLQVRHDILHRVGHGRACPDAGDRLGRRAGRSRVRSAGGPGPVRRPGRPRGRRRAPRLLGPHGGLPAQHSRPARGGRSPAGGPGRLLRDAPGE
ncbi:MAG: hypothetical protein C4551_07720 [Bacillota bacterium]|nr:MAG: hypothetical protein C4551_07720 [Bacillota bacterium]